jgi:5'-phosphate synthase pdxT subunit
MKIGVLALQGDFAEHISILTQLGADTAEVRLPNHLHDLDGLVIPGGESTTIARLLDRWSLLEPIRKRAQDAMAIWGTCAGAILLANEADDLDREGLRLMDIKVERNAFGRQVDSFEADLAIEAIGDAPYHCIFIRAPRITDTGPAVDVLAELEDGTIVAARQDKILASVFHPELTEDHRFHQLFLEMAAGDVVPISIKRTAGRAQQ